MLLLHRGVEKDEENGEERVRHMRMATFMYNNVYFMFYHLILRI